jgi:hypothetical protein
MQLTEKRPAQDNIYLSRNRMSAFREKKRHIFSGFFEEYVIQNRRFRRR